MQSVPSSASSWAQINHTRKLKKVHTAGRGANRACVRGAGGEAPRWRSGRSCLLDDTLEWKRHSFNPICYCKEGAVVVVLGCTGRADATAWRRARTRDADAKLTLWCHKPSIRQQKQAAREQHARPCCLPALASLHRKVQTLAMDVIHRESAAPFLLAHARRWPQFLMFFNNNLHPSPISHAHFPAQLRQTSRWGPSAKVVVDVDVVVVLEYLRGCDCGFECLCQFCFDTMFQSSFFVSCQQADGLTDRQAAWLAGSLAGKSARNK